MIVLLTILLLIALYKYNKFKGKFISVMIFAGMISFFFSFTSASIANDFGIVFIVIITILFFKKSTFKQLYNYHFMKVGLLLLLYYSMQVIRTLVTKEEDPLFSLITFRTNVLLLIPFVLIKLNINELTKIAQVIYKITLVVTVLYILQFIIRLNLISFDSFFTKIEKERIGNYPQWMFYFFFWGLIFFKENKIYKVGTFVMFFGCLLTQNRLAFASLILLSVIYLTFKTRKFAIVFALGFSALIGSYFIKDLPIFARYSEIEKSSMSVDDIIYYEPGSDNMTFRLALLYERFDYLLNNRLLTFGAGPMNEKSPKTLSRFDFKINTAVGEDWTYMNIDTMDLTWSNILLKYGVFGVLLVVLLFISIWVTFIKNKTINFGVIGLLMSAQCFFNTIVNDCWTNISMFPIYLLVVLTIKYEEQSISPIQ